VAAFIGSVAPAAASPAERHNPGQSDHGAGLPGDVSARPSRDVRMTP